MNYFGKYIVWIPLATASTGRFEGPTIFSAILNAKAEIVSDGLTSKDDGTIPQFTI
jgi:hypothetical protein